MLGWRAILYLHRIFHYLRKDKKPGIRSPLEHYHFIRTRDKPISCHKRSYPWPTCNAYWVLYTIYQCTLQQSSKFPRKISAFSERITYQRIFIKCRLKYTWIVFITHLCLCWTRFSTFNWHPDGLRSNCEPSEVSPTHWSPTHCSHQISALFRHCVEVNFPKFANKNTHYIRLRIFSTILCIRDIAQQ